jgi:hypothetical protein
MTRPFALLWAMSTLVACTPGQFGTPSQPRLDANPNVPEVPEAAPAITPPPVACETLKIATLADVETKFIAVRCGVLPPGVTEGSCHSTVFPPRNLDKPGMVRAALVDQKSQASCTSDKYVNRADVTRSFILAKVLAPADAVNCPSGGVAGAGGIRMPDQAVNPKPALLSPDERNCFMWYITEIAR